jgi:hypothetical protein
MFTVQQYRTKADEYAALLETARSPAETTEYRELQQTYTSFADNLDWLAANAGKTVSSDANHLPNIERNKRREERAEQERILRCLGAAVILNWNTIPMKLQRSLFEDASSMPGDQSEVLRIALAKFLHEHKDDAPHRPQYQKQAQHLARP